MKTKIYYRLVLDLLGKNVNSCVCPIFNSEEEATHYWEIEFRDRDKKDGYDEKWNKTPLRIQQIIEINLWAD